MSVAANVVVQVERNGALEIREVKLPDPSPHQVIVKLIATGLCQSQIWWTHQPRERPVLFGHEGYGVVAQTGSAVTDVKEGDFVLVTWLPRLGPDGRMPEISTLDIGGGQTGAAPNVFTWADYTLVDDLYVRKLSAGKHSDATAIIGCAVITGAGAVINSAETRKGDRVAVFGAGGVGLCAISAARVIEADEVVAVDISDTKLAFSRKFGATRTVNSAAGDPVERIHSLLPGRCGCCSGADVALDCVGLPQTTTQAYHSLRDGRLGVERGGKCVVVGLPKANCDLPALNMVMKEKTVMGSIAGSCKQEQIDDFVDWYRDGHLDLESMISDRVAFADIADGAARLERGEIEGRALAII